MSLSVAPLAHLALLVALVPLAGCGSDDDRPTGGEESGRVTPRPS